MSEAKDMPRFATSLFLGCLGEFERVYWNKYQDVWDEYEDADLGDVHFRHYDWNEPNTFNFWIDGHQLRIAFYKHPGRGMESSHELTPAEWIEWHDRVFAELERVDDEGRDHGE